MVFSSLIFLNVFLPLFFVCYFAVPARFISVRNFVILIFSLVFYGWGEPVLIWCMLLCIFVNWLAGRVIHTFRDNKLIARAALIMALSVSLGLLAWFKYAEFIIENYNHLLRLMSLEGFKIKLDSRILLPVGISFYTFQALSYTIDLYRGNVPVARSILDFGAYVTMFPQLVAGPIVRYENIFAELKTRETTLAGFASGAQRFFVGLFKKIIIANQVAAIADQVFALPGDQLNFTVAWLGVIAYTLQIYFDFSAYSDMAIGLGRMLGFEFLENFNHPYIAKDIREFWRRWHISLSTWFRDYLYIPLGGSRYGVKRTCVNLWIVFLVCGLWHGASWTFIVWGVFHGSFLVLERFWLGRFLEERSGYLRHLYTLLVVMTGWVFFRASSLGQAISFIGTMLGLRQPQEVTRFSVEFLDTVKVAVILTGILGASGWPLRIYQRVSLLAAQQGRLAIVIKEGAALMLTAFFALLTWMYLVNGSYNPFIYYRF